MIEAVECLVGKRGFGPESRLSLDSGSLVRSTPFSGRGRLREYAQPQSGEVGSWAGKNHLAHTTALPASNQRPPRRLGPCPHPQRAGRIFRADTLISNASGATSGPKTSRRKRRQFPRQIDARLCALSGYADTFARNQARATSDPKPIRRARQQFLRQIGAHCRALGGGADTLTRHADLAIGAEDLAAQAQPVTVKLCQPADGRLA